MSFRSASQPTAVLMMLISRFPGSSIAGHHTARLDTTPTSGQPFEEPEIKARLNLFNYRIPYGADILRTIHWNASFLRIELSGSLFFTPLFPVSATAPHVQ